MFMKAVRAVVEIFTHGHTPRPFTLADTEQKPKGWETRARGPGGGCRPPGEGREPRQVSGAALGP